MPPAWVWLPDDIGPRSNFLASKGLFNSIFFFSPSDFSAGTQMPLPSQVANMPVRDASPSGVSRPHQTVLSPRIMTHGSAFNLSPRSPSRGGQPNLLSPSVWLSCSGKTEPRSTPRCVWGSNASAAGSLRHVSELDDSGTLNQGNCSIRRQQRSPSLGCLDPARSTDSILAFSHTGKPKMSISPTSRAQVAAE